MTESFSDIKEAIPASPTTITIESGLSNTDEKNADDAIRVFRALGDSKIEADELAKRRLLRRIDLRMMPVLCIVYGLNYLDKTTLSYASVMGLLTDLRLSADNYRWLGSIFYIGYLVWEMPAGRLMQWLPLAKYNAANIVLWGLTLSCFVAAKNFRDTVVLRLFLGIFEASVTLGFALITSQWYTKREQASRIAIWVSFNGFAQIFGGCVAYGFAIHNQSFSLTAWKAIFLLNGILTIVMGVIFFLVIPDSQLNAKWLSPEDRALAVERVRSNQQGIGNRYFKRYQFIEALRDPITWAFLVLALATNITNGGLSNFFSQLIVSFGFTPEQSLLYGTPAGAVQVVVLFVWGFVSQRYGNRILWSIVGIILSIIGSALIFALPLEMRHGRLIGFYFTTAYCTGFIAALTLVASNIAGYTKKTTVGALYLVGYCAGNIIGPQTFRAEDTPRFVSAEITIIVMYCICAVTMIFIYFHYRRQNKKKEAIRASPGYKKIENQEWMDLTDWENDEFVYEL